MLDAARRTCVFLRKAWRAGLIPVGLGTVPIAEIRFSTPNAWLASWMAGTTCTVYATPHYALLVGSERLVPQETAYWAWQRSLRGTDHPRPDEWIEAMLVRLLTLFASIRRNGYRHRCIADRLAVLEDLTLWDGGHRLACLGALGWTQVPVVRLRRRGRWLSGI